MSNEKTQALDPTDGTTPVTLPAMDPCCQSPCDPPWRPGPSCTTFTETRTSTVSLAGKDVGGDFGRGVVVVSVSYTHRLCLIGKQHGGLAYTLTLLPGEKMTLYQSDRYRRTTTETERFSVQTTFAQFVSALYQKENSSDSSALAQVLNSQTQSSGVSGGGGINFLGLFSLGGGGSSSSTSKSSSAFDFSTHSSASQFLSLAQQASQYTDLQRSVTISNYEDSEKLSTTQRTLANNNPCHAVTYFVRKVLDVYAITTTVSAVTFQVKAGNYVSPVLTPDQLGQVKGQYRAAVAAIIKGLPALGESLKHETVLTVPTDGVVFDPELAHCCSLDPELEQASLIKLEREQAEAQKIGLELQLMALEVQRRQALLAAGTLAPFEPAPPPTTVVA
jgi:thermitase